MLFNFNQTSCKVGCWAVAAEALGGMVGALFLFLSHILEEAIH